MVEAGTRYRRLLPALVLLFFPLRAEAQQERNDTLYVDHADSLVGLEINGERARELIGHVRFHQGKTYVTCARATRFMESNRISLEGVVEVRDDSMRMVGNRGMYYASEKMAEAFDSVRLEDPTTTLRAGYGRYYTSERKAHFEKNVYVEDTASVLTADTLTYFRDDQHSIATGRVTLVNARNGFTVHGGRLENFRKIRYSKVTENPEVIQVDTGAGGKRDTLVVRALTLESFQDSLERLIATDSVRITRSDLAAEAGVCRYLTGLDSIALERSPFVWYATGASEDNQVSGDSISIKLQKRKLQTVYVRGRAVAISRADSLNPARFNQLTGQEILLHFRDDKIQMIDVNTTATSLYYLFDRGKGNGANKTSGDHVGITFVNGHIDQISVVGGVEGQYYPEKMIRGREAAYNLQGFNWRERRFGKYEVNSAAGPASIQN